MKIIKVSQKKEREWVVLDGIDLKIEKENLEFWITEALRFEQQHERASRGNFTDPGILRKLNQEIDNCKAVAERIRERLNKRGY